MVIAMTAVEKRLEALERDRLARYDAWVRSLSIEELDAEIEQRRRADPDAWVQLEAMTLEELEAAIAESMGHARH